MIIEAYSPVNKFKLINPYLSKFTNIIYRRMSTKPGLYACWNIAVKISKAKYLNNANVEDEKNVDSIFLMSEYLDNNPKVELLYSDSLISKEHNLIYDKALLSCDEKFSFPEFTYDNFINCNPPDYSPLYRKKIT